MGLGIPVEGLSAMVPETELAWPTILGGVPLGSAPLDESTAMVNFAEYRHLGSQMSGLSSRLKTTFNSIKTSVNPTTGFSKNSLSFLESGPRTRLLARFVLEWRSEAYERGRCIPLFFYLASDTS